MAALCLNNSQLCFMENVWSVRSLCEVYEVISFCSPVIITNSPVTLLSMLGLHSKSHCCKENCWFAKNFQLRSFIPRHALISNYVYIKKLATVFHLFIVGTSQIQKYLLQKFH